MMMVFYRLLAFDLEFVARDDIIITADVDAFIMTEKFLLPLSLVSISKFIKGTAVEVFSDSPCI